MEDVYKRQPQIAQQVIPQLAQQVMPQLAQQVIPQLAQQVIPQLVQQVMPQLVRQVIPQLPQQMMHPIFFPPQQSPCMIVMEIQFLWKEQFTKIMTANM